MWAVLGKGYVINHYENTWPSASAECHNWWFSLIVGAWAPRSRGLQAWERVTKQLVAVAMAMGRTPKLEHIHGGGVYWKPSWQMRKPEVSFACRLWRPPWTGLSSCPSCWHPWS